MLLLSPSGEVPLAELCSLLVCGISDVDTVCWCCSLETTELLTVAFVAGGGGLAGTGARWVPLSCVDRDVYSPP